MSFDSVKSFFSNLELWQKVVAGLFVAFIVAIVGFIIRPVCERKPEQPPISVTKGDESSVQIATGDRSKQEISVDKSEHITIGDKSIFIGRVEPGATVNINVIDYQDAVAQSASEKVRNLFKEARAFYAQGEFSKAIEKFMLCLDLEKDREKLGAINLQIGNCYYELRHFMKAAEFYGVALTEARRANDRKGEASALCNIATTYLKRPSSDGLARGNNVRQAVEKYQQVLIIFQKDEYPVEYAMTQSNLGNAYRDLPSATAEERGENVRKAIQCYQNALEIYKKDEYPVEYAGTQSNLGGAYRNLPSATAEERGENLRKAIQYCQNALEIYKKDEYPVEYAGTQNNLGNTYRDLPSATAEERGENLRKAIQCYQNALEIYRKDEYPQSYCITSVNLGAALISLDRTEEGCLWLKEAYSLKQFLPEQGKSLEPIIKEHCKE